MKLSIPRESVVQLEDLPNVGKAAASDLHILGITKPQQLIGKDPYQMYQDLCALTATRHDPCVCDVFIAIVDFMEGAPAAPWWHYTAQRKLRLPSKA
ncbi:MAG: helix-hairpin-helix domain-containing protein [Burkholderiales bacterium]|nr:helix-hairpin-helix domain-containing protein [Burkholderiales bacterium]